MRETKNGLFWSPNKKLTGGKRRRRKKKKKKKEGRDQAKVWIHDFCIEIMDSSMILIQELLGYGLLGFHLDLNLVPFLGFC